MFAIDAETYPIQPGCPLPPAVVFSIYDAHDEEVGLYHTKLDSSLTVQCDGADPDYSTIEHGDLNGIEAVGALLLCALEQDREIVAHNAKFDLGILFRHYPDLVRELVFQQDLAYCTKIGDQLRRTVTGEHKFMTMSGSTVRTKYSLDRLVELYYGRDISGGKGNDSWRLKYGQLDGTPIDQWDDDAVEYAVEDTLWAAACHRYQQNWDCKNLDDMPRQVSTGLSLQLSRCWGVLTDEDKIDELEERVDEKVDKVEDVLQDMGVLRSNGSRNMAVLRSYVWEAYDGSPPLTDTGHDEMEEGKQLPPGEVVDVAIDVLRQLKYDVFKENEVTDRVGEYIESNYEESAKIITFLRETDLEENYVNPFKRVSTSRETKEEAGTEAMNTLAKNGKYRTIKTSFLPKLKTGLERPIQPSYSEFKSTGRTSSWGDLNIQNQPRLEGLRECYQPRDGRVFIACDYDSIELRALAQTCLDLVGFSKLAEKYQANADFDPHLFMASKIRGCSFDEIKEAYAGGVDWAANLRQLAKVPNYGLPGGQGPRSLVSFAKGYGVDLTVQRAKQLKQIFFATWPGVTAYHEYIRSLLNPASNEGVFRLPRSGRARKGSYCQLANYGFQGPAADGWKNAIREFTQRAYCEPGDPLYESRIIAPMHDELVISTPEEEYRSAASGLESVMIDGMDSELPDIPVRGDAAAMECWIKGAEPKHDDNGELEIVGAA